MHKLSDLMREFLKGRHYATLATLNEDGSVHLTPVWYLFEDERFFVETGASARKLKNILARRLHLWSTAGGSKGPKCG